MGAKEMSHSLQTGFTQAWKKIKSILGFSKSYNLVLFAIFAGGFFGFTLASLKKLDVPGVFCKAGGRTAAEASPGECFYYLRGRWNTGIILHLSCILPGALLSCFQFVPIIRHKLLLFHRINGYIVMVLVLISNAGILMFVRHSFGGSLETQAWGGLLVILTTLGLAMAYYNIKKLQIDQHRAWMLRTFFYMGCIVTIRIIMSISGSIVTSIGGFYNIWPCEKLEWIIGSQFETLLKYPTCANSTISAVVLADFNGGEENIGAALGVSFGMAAWIATFLHAVGVEIYLRLTPAEAKRLRQISYERQLEAGFKSPGKAGLTVERFGDCGGESQFLAQEAEQYHNETRTDKNQISDTAA